MVEITWTGMMSAGLGLFLQTNPMIKVDATAHQNWYCFISFISIYKPEIDIILNRSEEYATLFNVFLLVTEIKIWCRGTARKSQQKQTHTVPWKWNSCRLSENENINQNFNFFCFQFTLLFKFALILSCLQCWILIY